jgi:hypothetical protein
MTTRAVFRLCGFLALTAALLLGAWPSAPSRAQQYLGKARQNCVGLVTVASPSKSVNVPPFQAITVDVGSEQVAVSCQGQQPVTVQCPQSTNRVLIDRSQGSNIYSIICLKK